MRAALISHQECGGVSQAQRAVRTDIQDIPTATRIQAKWRIACWAVLRLIFPDKLVKTCLVGDMTAGELQDSLSPQCVLERLLTDGTFTAHKSSLPPSLPAINLHHPGCRVSRSRVEGETSAIRMSQLSGGIGWRRVRWPG